MMAGITSGPNRLKMLLLFALLLEGVFGASLGSSGDRYGPKFEYGGRDDGHHFVTFNYGSDGVYKFAFKLPDQSRQEERNEEGEVRGSYSFIDPEGEEFSLKYLADKGGFQPEADHLPVAPEETEDVQVARKAFADFYEETVKYLEALSSKEGSDEDDGRYKSSSRDQEVSGSYPSSSRAQSLGGSYGSRGGYEASRLGDIDGDDDDDDEDSSSESEEDDDDDDSSEEDGDDDSSEEEGEDDDSDEEDDDDDDEEREKSRESKRGDRDERRKGKNDEEDEEEDEEDKGKDDEKERKRSSRKEGGRKNRNYRSGRKSGDKRKD